MGLNASGKEKIGGSFSLSSMKILKHGVSFSQWFFFFVFLFNGKGDFENTKYSLRG